MDEVHEEGSHLLNPKERKNIGGKADTEPLKAELVKAVEAARAVLEGAEENRPSFSFLYSVLLRRLRGRLRSGLRDRPR